MNDFTQNHYIVCLQDLLLQCLILPILIYFLEMNEMEEIPPAKPLNSNEWKPFSRKFCLGLSQTVTKGEREKICVSEV